MEDVNEYLSSKGLWGMASGQAQQPIRRKQSYKSGGNWKKLILHCTIDMWRSAIVVFFPFHLPLGSASTNMRLEISCCLLSAQLGRCSVHEKDTGVEIGIKMQVVQTIRLSSVKFVHNNECTSSTTPLINLFPPTTLAPPHLHGYIPLKCNEGEVLFQISHSIGCTRQQATQPSPTFQVKRTNACSHGI